MIPQPSSWFHTPTVLNSPFCDRRRCLDPAATDLNDDVQVVEGPLNGINGPVNGDMGPVGG
jgi:hypothetical protein